MNLPSSISPSLRGRCAVKLLLAAALLLVIAAAAWMLFLPRMMAAVVRSRTGFELQVQRAWVNPFTANVAIRGLVLQNPEGWPSRDFIDLREFKADVKLFSLLGERLEAEEVVLDLARVTLVRDAEGALNAVTFKDGFAGQAPAPEAQKPTPAPEEPGRQFLIKRLVVKLDQVTYADHSGRRPAVREYPVKINREMTDVDSVAELISPLYTANIAVVTEALGGMFQESVELLKGTGEALKGAGQKAGEAVKGFLDKFRPKN